MDEACDKCGAWTELGRQKFAERAKCSPLYGTDFQNPLSEAIVDIRNQLTELRGKLGDIRLAYPAWGERTESVEGLLTCGLIALHYVFAEMRKHEEEMVPNND